MRQERIWKLPEICLERTCHARDVVEGLDIGEVEGIIVTTLKELLDLLGLGRAACLSVDTLILHAYVISLRNG